MLQDLRLHGRYMRMDNDLWPVVRESARRILRLEHILIKLPHELSSDYKFLCDEISNNIPSRLIFPEVQYGDYEKIEVKLTKPELDYDEILIEIGLEEPESKYMLDRIRFVSRLEMVTRIMQRLTFCRLSRMYWLWWTKF